MKTQRHVTANRSLLRIWISVRTLSAVAHLYEGDRFPEGLEHTYPGLRDGLLRTGVLRPDKEGRAVIRFVGVAIQDAVTVVMLPKVRVAARPDHVQRQAVRAMRTYARSAPSHWPAPVG